MRAIVRSQYGGPEQLVIRDIPTPVPQDGEVLIKVKAFGLNHAEIYMRKGIWGEVASVSGIECVGQVESDPSGSLIKGQTVAAIMGGMGRTRNGSYSEYVCAPLSNVFRLETPLDWAEFAAIPEVYATAWSCLYGNLRVKSGDVLFVRGGTSSLGQAAINVAKHAGLTVLTSTRSSDKVELLKELGATQVLIENGGLSETVRSQYPEGIDSVLDLVGNSTLLDSLKMVHKDGSVCIAGFLGGGAPIAFDPLTQMPSGINLSFFASFMLGTTEFPLANIPMQEIIQRVSDGSYKAKPVKVFNFEQIADAHRLMESNNANGKIVVTCG